MTKNPIKTKRIKRRSFKTEAIAYLRVSTKRQAELGSGLDGQLVAIEAFAREQGYSLTDIYKDVTSGADGSKLTQRPGLKGAIDKASHSGLPIIVNDASRISRDSSALLSIIKNEKVTFMSATEEALITSSMQKAAGERSQYERDRISSTTRVALQERKRSGVVLGNRKNLSEAQKKGAEANYLRAEKIAIQIADVLPDLSDNKITAQLVSDTLNSRNILSGRGNRWTASTVRLPLKRAREISVEREKLHYQENPSFGTF